MKAFAIAVLAYSLPLITAVPLEKRVLVVQTVTNVVVQTVDVTTTVWVKPGAPSPNAQVDNHVNDQKTNHHAHLQNHKNKNKNKMKINHPVQNKAPAPAQPQYSPPQQEAHQPPPAQQPAAPVVPVVPETPKQAPQPAAPAPAPQPQAPAPAPQTPQPVAPVPQPAAPVPAPVAQAKSKEVVNVESGSTANCGQVGKPCSGEITFYDTGLGACGTTDDGISENVFALAHEMMGTQSNGNPFCGRKAEVTLDGKTVVGKLVDKCMGCVGQDIDLSHKMFQALADEGRGRIADVKWKFID